LGFINFERISYFGRYDFENFKKEKKTKKILKSVGAKTGGECDRIRELVSGLVGKFFAVLLYILFYKSIRINFQKNY